MWEHVFKTKHPSTATVIQLICACNIVSRVILITSHITKSQDWTYGVYDEVWLCAIEDVRKIIPLLNGLPHYFVAKRLNVHI